MQPRFLRSLSLSVHTLLAACALGVGVAALPACESCDEEIYGVVVRALASDTRADLFAGAFDPYAGRGVVVGAGGTILEVDDNTQKISSSLGFTDRDLFGVAVDDDGHFLAVGAGGLILRREDDGSWTALASGTDADLLGIARFGWNWVAFGDGVILVSKDGVTWTKTAIDGRVRAVTMGSTIFYAVGEGGLAMSSPDLVTWTPFPKFTEADLTSGLGTLVLGAGVAFELSGTEGATPSPELAEAGIIDASGPWVITADGVALRFRLVDGTGDPVAVAGGGLARVIETGGYMTAYVVGSGGTVLRATEEVVDVDHHLCRRNNFGSVEGRPFVVEGVARSAPLCARADWRAELRPELTRLGPAERRLLADAWARSGQFEHASVASFARVVLDLLAHAAPPELVEAAQTACGEEVRHARLCFALASAYAGEALGPGPLLAPAAPPSADLAELAAATVLEGCINETCAALEALTARDLCEEPVVREVLAEIAADEARHAALAWRTVAWALRVGGEPVRDAVRAAFRRGLAADEGPTETDGCPPGQGRLSASQRADVRRAALRSVIRPQAASLLAGEARASDRPQVAPPVC